MCTTLLNIILSTRANRNYDLRNLVSAYELNCGDDIRLVPNNYSYLTRRHTIYIRGSVVQFVPNLSYNCRTRSKSRL